MTSSWKIAISVSCIVMIAGASIVGWVRREKAIEWKKSSEAVSETRTRAEEGNAKAEANLGNMYFHGRGVPQDYAEAVRWYRKAADQGYAKAQYNLGNMYYYGRGVPRDRAEAERWYHKAADQGDDYAQRALGFKGSGLSILGTITLSAMFLWCLRTLKDALLRQPDSCDRQQPALTMAAVCGLAYIVLSVYGALGSFASVLTVNAFHFAESLAAGITIAIAIHRVRPKEGQDCA